MSARPSLQMDERRPLAIVDTDTTDYYDGVGGLPPPHRLSGLYTSYSPPSSAFHLPSSGSHHQLSAGEHSSASLSHGGGDMQASQNFAMAGGYVSAAAPGMRTEQSFSSSHFGGKAQYGDMTHESIRDDDAFLANDVNERGGMSPAVAARERYLARKEAQGEGYGYGGYGAGAAGAGGKRGCFSGKRKWAWIGGAIVLVAIIVGVAVGVSMARSNANSTKGVTGVVQGDSTDPSKFTKDSRLHQSFYGMCYTPLNAQYPACGDSLDAVIEDVQLMSQLTTRLRLYGADCNVASYVLEAIQKTKVNMTVFLAAWVPQPADDPGNTVWERQMNEVINAIKTYGADNVEGISVGNEFLLNNGAESVLIDRMAEMRTQVAALNLNKAMPVGTADAGSMITTSLAQGSDFVMANVHAWFGEVPIDQAAQWTWSYTANQEPSSAAKATNNPPVYIAETGWPTNANSSQFLSLGPATAGVPQLNEFLSTYVCQANANVTTGDLYSKYFFFEAFDEPWKAIYGGVEPYWGLFNSNKTLKDGLVIPDCSHP